MERYKLNFGRDVDTDEPGVYILNLPNGFRFTHDHLLHVYAYDSIKELKEDIKHSVVKCYCNECFVEVKGKC